MCVDGAVSQRVGLAVGTYQARRVPASDLTRAVHVVGNRCGWCRGGDSNSYSLCGHSALNAACLPIPPPRLSRAPRRFCLVPAHTIIGVAPPACPPAALVVPGRRAGAWLRLAARYAGTFASIPISRITSNTSRERVSPASGLGALTLGTSMMPCQYRTYLHTEYAKGSKVQ